MKALEIVGKICGALLAISGVAALVGGMLWSQWIEPRVDHKLQRVNANLAVIAGAILAPDSTRAVMLQRFEYGPVPGR